MDAAKLFRVINDIQNDEQQLAITDKIGAIRGDIAQNNQAGLEAARVKFEELKTSFEQGLSYNFSATETRLLEEIHASEYFGKSLLDHIHSILSSRSFDMAQRIDDYRAKRTEFLNKMTRMTASFKEMSIEEYRPNQDEIGIVFSEEEGDLGVLQGNLGKFRRLLSVIVEITDTEYREIKITRVSSGSPLEFFSLQNMEAAAKFSDLLKNVVSAWQQVVKLKEKIKAADIDTTLDSTTKATYKSALEEQSRRIIETLEKDLPDKLLNEATKKPERGRQNEVRSELKAGIHFVLRWLGQGVELDVTMSRTTTTTNGTPATDAEQINMNTIKEANARLREMYKLPKEIRYLPLPAEDDIEEQSSVEDSPEETTGV